MESNLEKLISVHISKQDWIAAAIKRYGKDKSEWKFVCPCCGKIFKISDWEKVKKLPLQDCPEAGQEIDNCIWVGLSGINPVKIHDDDIVSLVTSIFDFADDPIVK